MNKVSPMPPHWRAGARVLGLLCGLFVLAAGEAAGPGTPATASGAAQASRIWMAVADRRFALTLVDTEAARAFAALLPLTLDMAELNGNEKHAALPRSLSANASRPGTIRNGDLMLYGANTLVVFYASFDSPYAYTRLGRIDDPAGLAQALGRGGVRVVFSAD